MAKDNKATFYVTLETRYLIFTNNIHLRLLCAGYENGCFWSPVDIYKWACRAVFRA